MSRARAPCGLSPGLGRGDENVENVSKLFPLWLKERSGAALTGYENREKGEVTICLLMSPTRWERGREKDDRVW